MTTPLFGHVSPETSYVVNDYPYGFRLRCKIRYWLEKHPKRGYRFVSQTTNPKAAIEVWNKPKASTYAIFGASMYIDADGHVQWTSISEYDDAARALAFVRDMALPADDLALLRGWAKAKQLFAEKIASGAAYFTVRVNGVEQPREERSDAEKERDAAEVKAWREVADLLESYRGACRLHPDCRQSDVVGKLCEADRVSGTAKAS